MIVFCCVNANNYEGRGKEYVEILYDSIQRNLPNGFEAKFVCFTDDSEDYHPGIEKRQLHGRLSGWWNKLYLFKQGHFNDGDRIVYFDLDTCIVGPLDEIVKYGGRLAILRDVYRPNGLQSSVMLWDANKTTKIWEDYEGNDGVYPFINGGDQAWIERYYNFCDILQNLFPFVFSSYKQHVNDIIPRKTSVVFFHGKPRPHEVTGNWVERIWKVGGGSVASWKVEANTSDEIMRENVLHSLDLPCELLDGKYAEPNEDRLIICGGGPSLADSLSEIAIAQRGGAIIWALNGTFRYLSERGIEPNAHILLDSRKENIDFVPSKTDALLLYAAQCHPEVFQKAMNAGKVIIWCPSIKCIVDVLTEKKMDASVVCAGSTVGLKSIGLAQLFGFRNVDLYGYDSSYRGNENHAYKQPLNDKENIVDITVGDRKFKCASWMATQAEEFKGCIDNFLHAGMRISVHGDGLLPYVASLIAL